MSDQQQVSYSGMTTGPLQAGEWVGITDAKGNRKSIQLTPGRIHHTTKGALSHDQIIGCEEGSVVSTVGGLHYTVFRPLLNEYMVTMPRGAAVIYPKDTAQILMRADIFPGARVLEAGVGSGALSLGILRAIGAEGILYSYERREEFATIAQANVAQWMKGQPSNWHLRLGDLVESCTDDPVDRVILDMLAPWECIDRVAEVLVPGGLICCYVATTTQMGRVTDQLRAHGSFTEPWLSETTIREWHAEGLAIRPAHGASSHTGFLVIARRMAHGVSAPMRRRRPAPGAYGPDYHGPIPKNIAAEKIADSTRVADERG